MGSCIYRGDRAAYFGIAQNGLPAIRSVMFLTSSLIACTSFSPMPGLGFWHGPIENKGSFSHACDDLLRQCAGLSLNDASDRFVPHTN